MRIRTAGRRRRWKIAAAALLVLAALACSALWRYSGGDSLAVTAPSRPARGNKHDVSGSKAASGGGGGGGGGGGSEPADGTDAAGEGDAARSNGGGAAEGTSSASARHWKDPPPRRRYPPVAAPDPTVVKQRCGGALGDWCGRYYGQEPIPARPPPQGNRTCLWGNAQQQCNFVGVCDAMAGWCACPAGWRGDDCSTRMRRPCSQHNRPVGSFEPYDQPTDPSNGGMTLMCADLCDDDIAHCYCNSTFPHGRIPAAITDPPGTRPLRQGRPVPHLCRRNKGYDGQPSYFGSVEPELLYGEGGWCIADSPKFQCPCLLDGWGGPTCETPYEAFCPNQCNGHGECEQGFCKCHEDWFGHDCAYRTAGTPWTPGMEDGERPWLKPFVHTPAARDPEPGHTRKRPLIYVYELPPWYNSVMLQYRVERGDCVHRVFDDHNSSLRNDGWLYLDTLIHEALLQSEHRTLDPEEADYFYMPVYAPCLIFPVLDSNDFPFFHGGPAAHRLHGGTNMLIEAQSWIRSHFPYWDRNGGRDHILAALHDEGSCWVPAVLRPAIILSHWGRTDEGHKGQSGYQPDIYTAEATHPVYQPEGHLHKLGNFPCYDPSKDLIIPATYHPKKYEDSPLLGAPALERSILAVFKGRMQMENPAYSRLTRQRMANYTTELGWWKEHKIWVGEASPPGHSGGYSKLLASSDFCFALMGDGWASRFDDAVVHGCIPVVIQDEIEQAWHGVLDLDSYTVRIAEKDMERVPEILEAISEEDRARMRANVAKVWRRHLWTGYRHYGDLARTMLQQRQNSTAAAEVLSQPAPLLGWDPGEDDAFSTLMQVLYARVDELGAHAPLPPERSGKGSRRRRRA